MTGVLVLPGDAPEADWLAARRLGVTASEIAIVMGLAPDSWDSAYSLWHRKAGNLPEREDDGSEAMSLGTFLEEYVAIRFHERRPEFSVWGSGRELYAHPDRLWQLATPDRLVSEVSAEVNTRRGMVYMAGDIVAALEAKTSASFEDWGEEGTDEIPVYYRCQALWQADVLGVATVFVACLFLHNRTVRVYELTIDAQAQMDLNIMRAEAEAFLECLRTGVAPPVDWRPETGKAIRRLHPSFIDDDVVVPERLRISYQAALRKFKAADRRKDEMSNQMLALMGDHRRAIAARLDPNERPVVIATRSISEPERIDTKLLRTEYPRVARAVTKPPKPEVRLLPAREK